MLFPFSCHPCQWQIPAPLDEGIKDTWARFPYGVTYVLDKAGYSIDAGYDAVVYGNIPGGGMSRSASLSVNLILTTYVADKANRPSLFYPIVCGYEYLRV